MEDSDGIKPSKERLKRILHDVALERCCVDQVVDHQGNTLLHLAVLLECDEIINRLLLCGANPRIFNHDGFSAIQLAENMGAQSSIKIFDKWDRFHKLITTNDFCAIKDIPLESSTILYCSRYLAVFEDYVDWTTASRRFRVKELLDKIKLDERDDFNRLTVICSEATQMQSKLHAVSERLIALRHKLSVQFWNEDSAVRKLRSSLLSVTDLIAGIRSKLASTQNVTYWSGSIQVRLHKGIFLELWKSFGMTVTASSISITRLEGEHKNKQTIAVDDLVRVVIIKNAEDNSLYKGLLLEYHKPTDGKDRSSWRLQTLHLRFKESSSKQKEFSRLPATEHLAHVLKLLNKNVEIRCEIDGSRRVEYEVGSPAKMEALDDCSIQRDHQRLRRATFDASFSPRYLDNEELIGSLRGVSRSSLSMLTDSRNCSSSSSRSMSMSANSRSMSMSINSGITSIESYVSSNYSSSSRRRCALQRIAEDDQGNSRVQSRDDTEVVSQSFLPKPARYSLSSRMEPSDVDFSFFDQGRRAVPSGPIEDVRYLHDLRLMLSDSVTARDQIQKELEMSIASKESLRLPLAFLKALNREISNAQALSFVPTSMRLDVVLAAIESHSKALDSNQRDEFAALRRGQSFAGQQQSSSTDVSDLSIPLHLVKFLASSGDNDDNNEYADRPSLSMNKAYSGCSFSIMPSTPETIRPFARSNSCVMDSVLSPSFVLRSPLPSEIAAAPAPRPLSPRKVLGPPPSVLRQEFDDAISCIESLVRCYQQGLDDAVRYAQLLILREDLWRRYQNLKEEPSVASSAGQDLVDVEF